VIQVKLAALAFRAYTGQSFEQHFQAKHKGCKMADHKLSAVTTLIVGEETTTAVFGEEATTEAVGEEHPSTSPQGEESPSALTAGEQAGRGGPFGAY
jgi:hypothetical protein